MRLPLLALLLSGCTSMLPMTHGSFPEKDIARVMKETGLPESVVRDTTIHVVEKKRLGCFQLVKKCWSGLPWYLKALGSVPLACTTIYQWPGGTKSATINHCWWTTEGVMEHEREHAKGAGHRYW